MVNEQTRGKKGFATAVIGTILVALCCFTPLLVITLGLVGLGFLTPYLDYILLPALVVMVYAYIIGFYGVIPTDPGGLSRYVTVVGQSLVLVSFPPTAG